MSRPSFAINTIAATEPKYSHGYSIERVDELKILKSAIELRDLGEQPVTLKEFKEVIVPWNRVHRVEQFVLFPEKQAKEKKTRAAAKPKKLTKKAIQDRLNTLIFAKATGKEITEEEQTFINDQLALAGSLGAL